MAEREHQRDEQHSTALAESMLLRGMRTLTDECAQGPHRAAAGATCGEAGRLLGLTDLDSANGTFLNGRRVLSEQPLAVGDLIEIGTSCLHVRGITPLAIPT